MLKTLPLCALVALSLCQSTQPPKQQITKHLIVADSGGPMNIYHNKEYPSSERDAFYKHKEEVSCRKSLPSRQDVEHFITTVCAVGKLKKHVAYVDSLIQNTPYDDSIQNVTPPDYSLDRFSRDTVGGIFKGNIIKHEKSGTLEALIYTSSRYTDFAFGDPSLWIAVSKNQGKTWERYFTGLYHKQPFGLKWYSKLPLIRDENTLQIEAALLQQTVNHSHPVGLPKYDLLQDGLVLTFNLHVLAQDSDGDGLTDIVEEKFRTDPSNKDSNGNGVPDLADVNPRQSTPKTDASSVFEYILNQEFRPKDVTAFMAEMERLKSLPDSLRAKEREKAFDWKEFPVSTSGVCCATSLRSTLLIVTDDPNIQAIQPQHVRVIIMTPQEYEQRPNGKLKTDLAMMFLSPLFKVDGKKDLYIVDKTYQTGRGTYLVEKTKEGWRIRPLMSYIS